MKNYQVSLFGVALMVLVVSCKKEDVQAKNTATSTVSSTIQWKSLKNWSSTGSDSQATLSSKVSDSSITSSVAAGGLALVFKKNGTDVQSLPFQENDSKTFWYYQISKGSVQINVDNNSGDNLNSQAFSYFIITPEKLSSLEASGKTKLDLLQLSYEQAVALLK
jgi:hypothetical protein